MNYSFSRSVAAVSYTHLLLKVACNTAERAEMREIATIYKSKIIDLSPDSMVFELTGRPERCV